MLGIKKCVRENSVVRGMGWGKSGDSIKRHPKLLIQSSKQSGSPEQDLILGPNRLSLIEF